MKQSGSGQAQGAKSKFGKISLAKTEISKRASLQEFQRQYFSSKQSNIQSKRGVGLNWYIGKTMIKNEKLYISELSNFTKIVAYELINMQTLKSKGGVLKLEISITSKEQSDFTWAINSSYELEKFQSHLSKNGITLKQIYLILRKYGQHSIIPLFEKETDDTAQRSARK